MYTDPDGALTAADAIGAGDDRPFAGVPIAIKDPPGRRAAVQLGSRLFGDFVPAHDASWCAACARPAS